MRLSFYEAKYDQKYLTIEQIEKKSEMRLIKDIARAHGIDEFRVRVHVQRGTEFYSLRMLLTDDFPTWSSLFEALSYEKFKEDLTAQFFKLGEQFDTQEEEVKVYTRSLGYSLATLGFFQHEQELPTTAPLVSSLPRSHL